MAKAEYGVSGVKTFIVNQLGQVYERDRLADERTCHGLTQFDPDKSWKKCE